MTQFLNERLSYSDAKLVTESALDEDGNKSWYMQGIFIQGDTRNLNERVYPVAEIKRAVDNIQSLLDSGESVLGECDHPQELTINLDRVSHTIEKMWMDGKCGMGKLKLLETPKGEIIKAMLKGKVKLGVSSRGSGNVDHRGYVSDFEIVTVDIVAKPSAPNAYPVAVYEAFNGRRGAVLEDLARAVANDPKAQKYLVTEALNWIENLK